MSPDEHQPSRTRVPMPIAALSDPHMSDAARHPKRAEGVIALVLFASIVLFAIAGAAYCLLSQRATSTVAQKA